MEEPMRRSIKTNKHAESDFKVLQGGTLPEKVVQRQFAEVNRNWLAELDEESAIRQEAGKYLNQIGTDGGAATNDAPAISRLRRLTGRLASRKLKLPGKLGGVPGVWGSYTLRFTPPYTALGTSISGQIS